MHAYTQIVHKAYMNIHISHICGTYIGIYIYIWHMTCMHACVYISIYVITLSSIYLYMYVWFTFLSGSLAKNTIQSINKMYT